MGKIQLTKIDKENWCFILYEKPDKSWIGSFPYSPVSAVDVSMLIELTEDEKSETQKDRNYLIEFSEHLRNNHKDYLKRAVHDSLYSMS